VLSLAKEKKRVSSFWKDTRGFASVGDGASDVNSVLTFVSLAHDMSG